MESDGCPSPRVGHSALTLGNAFIVFGGDTKVEETDVLDDNLYLLNTNTLKWTVPNPVGSRPSGRYGHTISTVGSTLYVFGGQLDDFFFDDLVAYDLSTLQSPNSKWVFIKPNSPSPPPRTNHTMVTFEDKLYLFGGTDGKLWYSDTWCYDPKENIWTRLECAGYIPSPCEGHSATIVGDIMYVFGGRSSEGKDLGSLSALKIPSRKWFSFQNMGPGPSPRSGHSMSAFAGHKILIMGGESPEYDPQDPSGQQIQPTSTVYVLDTSRINYPPSASEVAPTKKLSRELSRGSMNNVQKQISSPPPQHPQDPSEQNDRNSRTESAYSELTPGYGYERVEVGEQSNEDPSSNNVPRSSQDTTEKPDEFINKSALNSKIDSTENAPNTINPNSSSNLVTPPSTGHSGTSSPYSTDTITDSATTSPQYDKRLNNGNTAAGIGAVVAGAGAIAANTFSTPSSTTTRHSSKSVDSNDTSFESINQTLEQLRASNAWYEQELAAAREAGYVPSNRVMPTLLSKQALKSPKKLPDEDDRKILINALTELQDELVEVQSNLHQQASQASEKIILAETERDDALEKIKLLEAQLKAANVNGSVPHTSRDINGDIIQFSSEKQYQEEIARLKAELAQMPNQTNAESRSLDPENDYDKIHLNNIHLEQQLRELSDKVVLANHESSRLRVQLEDIQSRYKILEDTTEDQVNTIAAATLAVSSSQTKLRETEKMLAAKEAERAEMVNTIAELKSELEELKFKYDDVSKQLEDKQQLTRSPQTGGEHGGESDSVENLSTNVSKLMAMWAGAKMFQKVTKKGSNSTKTRSVSDSSNENTEENKEDDEVDSEVDPQVELLQTQLAEVTKLYESHKQASKESTMELSKALEELSSLRNQLKTSQTEMDDLKKELEDSRNMIEQGKEQINSNQKSIDEATEKLRSANLEKDEEITNLKTKLSELTTEIESLKDKYKSLEGEYDGTLQYVGTSEKALKKTREELSKYKEMNVRLQQEVDNLKLQVQDEDDDDNTAGNDVESVGSRTRVGTPPARNYNSRQLDLQLRDLRAQVIILQEERDDLRQKSLELKKKLITQDEELKDAQAHVQELLKENHELQDSFRKENSTTPNNAHTSTHFVERGSPVNPEQADQTLDSLTSELDQIRNNRERLSGLINNSHSTSLD